MRDLIILDRDGTLNRKTVSSRYVCSLESFQWRRGALDALSLLTKGGATVCVATNQRGLSTGEIQMTDYVKICEAMVADASDVGAELSWVCTCPHGDGMCGCRKPGTLMIETILALTGYRANQAVFVGDSVVDEKAASAAGISFIDARKPWSTVFREIVALTKFGIMDDSQKRERIGSERTLQPLCFSGTGLSSHRGMNPIVECEDA